MFIASYIGMLIYKLNHLPINWIACGKKLAKFWLQWSLIGICIYFIEPPLSNTFGKSGVTLSMYCILCRAKDSRSSLLAALPRYKWGKISTGKSLSSISGPGMQKRIRYCCCITFSTIILYCYITILYHSCIILFSININCCCMVLFNYTLRRSAHQLNHMCCHCQNLNKTWLVEWISEGI